MTDRKEYLESLVKGSIVGHLIGDALGFPFSNKRVMPVQVDMIPTDDGNLPGMYQGPATLSLCTMSSINEFKDINSEDILDKFNDFLVAGFLASSDECSDVSPLTIESIKNHSNGMPPDKCGVKNDSGSDAINYDSECVARILPIALFCATEKTDVLIEKSKEICQLTHVSIDSEIICAAYCLIIRNLLLQKSEKVFDVLYQYHKEHNAEYLPALDKIRYWPDNNTPTGSVSPVGCFWTAWKSFSQFENDFRNCVCSCIALGGDANSTGAVAGSISALVNGLSSIPTEWLNTIVLTGEVMGTINDFTEIIVDRVINDST